MNLPGPAQNVRRLKTLIVIAAMVRPASVAFDHLHVVAANIIRLGATSMDHRLEGTDEMGTTVHRIVTGVRAGRTMGEGVRHTTLTIQKSVN